MVNYPQIGNNAPAGPGTTQRALLVNPTPTWPAGGEMFAYAGASAKTSVKFVIGRNRVVIANTFGFCFLIQITPKECW